MIKRMIIILACYYNCHKVVVHELGSTHDTSIHQWTLTASCLYFLPVAHSSSPFVSFWSNGHYQWCFGCFHQSSLLQTFEILIHFLKFRTLLHLCIVYKHSGIQNWISMVYSSLWVACIMIPSFCDGMVLMLGVLWHVHVPWLHTDFEARKQSILLW
jgi:hypothetical protein